MLFVEFIAPAKKSTQAHKCLCALYYLKHNLGVEITKINQVRNILERARIVKKSDNINFSSSLMGLNEWVDSPAKGLWQITPSGERRVRSWLKIPEVELENENDTTILEQAVSNKISEPIVRDYFQEGIDCLKIGRLRACVVFLWSGAIFLIRKKLLTQNLKSLNAAIKKHDPKARDVKIIDDFAYVKDTVVLLVLKDLGLCDKAQKEVLEECLNLRNKCGHPTKYSPGPKRISSYVEELLSVLFP